MLHFFKKVFTLNNIIYFFYTKDAESDDDSLYALSMPLARLIKVPNASSGRLPRRTKAEAQVCSVKFRNFFLKNRFFKIACVSIVTTRSIGCSAYWRHVIASGHWICWLSRASTGNGRRCSCNLTLFQITFFYFLANTHAWNQCYFRYDSCVRDSWQSRIVIWWRCLTGMAARRRRMLLRTICRRCCVVRWVNTRMVMLGVMLKRILIFDKLWFVFCFDF